ncbi:MAG: 3-oxoacyl-ACP reductase FabG, partial [Pikeienuella sp.]
RVIVTGASKGIGAATALRLGRQGFHVTVHFGRDEAGAAEVAAQICRDNGSAEIIGFDISDREQTRDALDKLVADKGAYWGAVLNAGATRDNAFPSLTEEEWDGVLRTNLDGFYNVLHPLVMPMVRLRNGGRIVTMSSISGQIGNRGQVNYSASKAGIIGATKSLAAELAKRKITVNCVAPGLIETAMTADLPVDDVKKAIPLRRFGTADEVASLVGYLFSDDAAYITRQVISVNGGLA